MSLSYSIADLVTPEMNRAIATFGRSRELLQAGGKAVEVRLKQHFKERQAEGNRRGWKSKYFWRGTRGNSVSEKTALDSVTDTEAVVAIASLPFLHKLKGGTITAKRSKFLAIPLTEEAYQAGGKGTLREVFPDMKVVVTRRGAYLARSSGETVVDKGIRRERLRFLFKLKASVTQAADPRALPADGQLQAALGEGIAKAVPRLLKWK